jgi:hypothetical protein
MVLPCSTSLPIASLHFTSLHFTLRPVLIPHYTAMAGQTGWGGLHLIVFHPGTILNPGDTRPCFQNDNTSSTQTLDLQYSSISRSNLIRCDQSVATNSRSIESTIHLHSVLAACHAETHCYASRLTPMLTRSFCWALTRRGAHV